MSSVSSACKEVGLENLFFRALKIDGASDNVESLADAGGNDNVVKHTGGDHRQEQLDSDGDEGNVKEVLVYRLDHMRSKAKYTRLMGEFTSSCQLRGHLLFYKKFILIFLRGERARILEWHRLMTTENVDVDSRGRPCKERMLKEVFQSSQVSSDTDPENEGLQVIHAVDWKEVEQARSAYARLCKDDINLKSLLGMSS